LGITIHYSGKARDFDALTEILNTAQMFGAQHGWHFAMYDDPFGVMEDRDKDDPGYIEHDGPYRGIVLRPHRKCEPVRLNFRVSNEMTPAFTKTQFAPFEVHIEIIELFRAIAPFMDEFEVTDESGLWESGDIVEAEGTFAAVRRAIEGIEEEVDDPKFDSAGLPDFDEEDET
jgi:hypothetical protein